MALAPLARGQNLTGTVTNRTTGRPASGDDVVLLKLSEGMQEAARAKTDSQGKFTLKVDDSGKGPHLVKVNHQKVNYFRPAPPGSTSVDVEVYDVAPEVKGVSATVDVLRIQADAGTLQVAELFALKNSSNPPRTLMSDRSFEFMLPVEAEIDSSMAEGPGGMPVNSAPVPQKQKGRYAFVFPLRPGETRFQIAYHLPYPGQIGISPQPLYPLEHLVIMLPKTMQFVPEDPGAFQAMPADEASTVSGANVQVATGVKTGQALSFRVSGTGTLASESETAGQDSSSPANAGNSTRPGGGLGPPIDTPDPLHRYRWYILAGFAAMLVLGAIYVARHRPIVSENATGGVAEEEITRGPSKTAPQFPAGRSGLLIEALKEELFQLEVDRQQGRIAAADYDHAKAALDHTIRRALTRRRQ